MNAGESIGPYRVLELLGEGGMGEVYRARDTRLDRDVALKILPELFAADPDRLMRFEREAKTLAALNHPNIAHIHGLEQSAPSTGSGDGAVHALVMELVDGEDLAARIARGPVPLDEALPIARQIAQALEAAHGAGIVHRDLKPANIKVRPDGTVKVLDFGLAKAMDPAMSGPQNAEHSPTFTSPVLTRMGVILGTAAYMAPEQAKGRAVDKRADVWAFGVVLFEMLTGRRAFDGEDISEVLASVLRDSVPLDALPADTPSSIRRLLRRCLQKSPADRLDSMAAARLEIADAASGEPGAAAVVADRGPAVTGRRAAGTAALLLLAIAGGLALGWALFAAAPGSPAPVVRFVIPTESHPTGVAISANGDTLVYETDRIYARSLADDEARPLPGTEGARNAFVSPDGRWVGFFANGRLQKVAAAGGDPLTIAEASLDSPGAAWGPDGTVLFSPGWSTGLYSVPDDGGGTPVPVSTVATDSGERGHWWPHLMPDGRTVLFTIWMAGAGINDARIGALDLETGRHRVLMPGAAPKYFEPGRLLYSHAGKYHVVGFDPVEVAVAGDASQVLPDAMALDPSGTREKPVAVSLDGTLLYVMGPMNPPVTLSWVGASGAIAPIPLGAQEWRSLALAPDGRRLAGDRTVGGVSALFLVDLVRHTEMRVGGPGAMFDGKWSPTGEFLVFTGMRAGHFDTYLLRPDDGVVRPVIEEPHDQNPTAVTRDGRVVLFDYRGDGMPVLSVADLKEPLPRRPLPIPLGSLLDVAVSPDDRWLALMTSASGRPEVVVHALSGDGPAVRVSSRGGTRPIWSDRDRILYYQRGDEIVAARYAATATRFMVEGEETVMRIPGHLIGLAPDGRFLTAQELPSQRRQVRVVVNWE